MAKDDIEAQADEQVEDVAQTEEAVDEEKAAMEKLKESLDVSVEDIGTLRKKVTVTVPRETIDEKLEEQYGELSRDAVVPGFRKGRAPRRLLEKRFGSEVGETITSSLLGSGYLAAIEKVDLKVLGDPLIYCKPKKVKEGEEATERLMSVREAFENMALPDDGPLTFACEVEVRPEFTLPELEGIPVEKPTIEVTDEDVDQQIERFRMMRGSYESVDGGKVQEDDVVGASLKMTVDGKVIKEEQNATLSARPQSIDNVPVTDLGKVLKGAKVGDEKTVRATVPEDDDRAELRGKEAEFTLTIKDIRRLKTPELTAEMLKPMGFESVDDFRTYVRGELEVRMKDVVQRGMRSQITKYLLEKTDLELPERLSQKQADRVVVRRMLDLYRQGVPEAEVRKHMDELTTTARKEAARDLKLSFIMEAIAEKIEPHVSEDEVNGQIALIAQQQNRRFDRVRDELIKNDGISSLFIQLRDEKIVDELLNKATVTETEAKADEGKKTKSKKTKKAAKKKKSSSRESSESDEDADSE